MNTRTPISSKRRHRLVWGAVGLCGVIAVALVTGLMVLPAYVERGQNVVLEHADYGIDTATKALHQSLFIADLHADTLMWNRPLAERASQGHVDLPRLREGHVALQVFAAVTKVPKGLNYESNNASSDQLRLLTMAQAWPPKTWNSPFERALYQAGRLNRSAAAGELRAIRTRADLRRFLLEREQQPGRVGGILAIEGLHAIEGDLDKLQRLHDAGYRVMGLHHFFDNELGGSLHGESQGGLTEFGRRTVNALQQLGVVIDLAHSSEAVVKEVLAMGAGPLIVSHTGVFGTCPSARNLPDALMRRIAEAGGIIGIGYWDGAVCDIDPAGIVRALHYAIELLGAEHVALGSDFDGATTTRLDASELAVLTQGLRERGVSDEDIARVMGGNVLALFQKALPGGAE